MKITLLPFLVLLFLTACQKEQVVSPDAELEARANKVMICHIDGQGLYHPLSISVNALPAHLAHGDYVPDADGDGYTAEGACTGSMDDCDDNNPDVHPGAEEVCGNGIDDNCDGNIDEGCCTGCCFPLFTEELFEGANFIFYYDAAVNNCELFPSDFVYIQGESFVAAAIDLDGQQYVIFGSDGFDCQLTVGVDITLEEYYASMAALRSVIEENGISNYCDGFFTSSGSTQSAMLKRLFEKVKIERSSRH